MLDVDDPKYQDANFQTNLNAAIYHKNLIFKGKGDDIEEVNMQQLEQQLVVVLTTLA